MSKFIALPVGQGDAFYLERKDFRVLVDGGKSKTAIAPWMNNICETDYLDVLVCTHNDSDHANGIIGLLENWEGKIHEVWLPGNWTAQLKNLFVDPNQFIETFFSDVQNLYADAQFRPRSLENLIDLENVNFSKMPNEIEIEINLENILNDSDDQYNIFLWSEFLMSLARMRFFLGGHPMEAQNLLLWDAINAASRIKAITRLAYERGCRVRFFKFGGNPSGGNKDLLCPVNSQEIATIAPGPISILKFLALTVANRESLVFLSPEVEEEPAVLFTADSDLNFPLLGALTRSPIVTSPHHGSDQNRSAYGVVRSWIAAADCEPIWVRSDCRSKRRPGKEYLAQTHRVCTVCNYGTCDRQTVRLESQQGMWRIAPGTVLCSCR